MGIERRLIKRVEKGGFAESEMKIRGPTPDKITVTENRVEATYGDKTEIWTADYADGVYTNIKREVVDTI